MRSLLLAVLLLLMAVCARAAAGVDYSFVWGERMYDACVKDVRESMKTNLRGLCDVLQDLLEVRTALWRRVVHALAIDC